ncbi:MAG TPA: cytochrome D1 domain-containing protein [Cyclobacteriaceae bacterium]|jgi:YVTN family beta-propeller protein|nr:cytochrome D1 domain-containing protein [Cyclobacteriaceae bacterium]
MNKSVLRSAALSLLVLVLAHAVSSAQNSKGNLLALSKSEHVVAIIDPNTLKIIAKVPVGPDPHEIIASADGKTAYVTNTGGGRAHEINVIDLVTQKALPNIDTKALLGPHGIDFVGGKAWFSAEGSKSVGRYDPASGQVDWVMGTGEDRTHMIYVTPDAKRIYTTNVNAGTVSILVDTTFAGPGGQPRNEWTHTVVKAARGCEGFDVSPDGKQLWTAAASDGSIAIVDLTSKKLISTIDAKLTGANRLKFTPDGKRVLVSSLRIGDLFVIDVASRKELKRVNIGKGGAGILVDADGSRAFVGCTQDNYVAVIDLKSLEVINRISLGGPDGLAWANH